MKISGTINCSKLLWGIFGLAFLGYGLFDLIEGISEIKHLEIGLLQFIAKLIVPMYIIGCSGYLLILKLVEKRK